MDQVLLMLADRKVLKAKQGKRKGMETAGLAMAAKADEDGLIAGRAADGTPIKGMWKGKSVARQLMEKEAEKRKKQERKRRRKGK